MNVLVMYNICLGMFGGWCLNGICCFCYVCLYEGFWCL